MYCFDVRKVGSHGELTNTFSYPGGGENNENTSDNDLYAESTGLVIIFVSRIILYILPKAYNLAWLA